MITKNLLKSLVIVSALFVGSVVVSADKNTAESGQQVTAYQTLTNLPVPKDIITKEEFRKIMDQFMSTGDNPGNLFKALHRAVHLPYYVAQAAKAKGSKKVDLNNPAVAAFSIVEGIRSLMDKVRIDPSISVNMVNACFAGDNVSDGSLLKSFLSFTGDDVEGYIATVVTSRAILDLWRREFAILAQNIIYSLPTTKERCAIWQKNYDKLMQKASAKSAQENTQTQVEVAA